MASTPLFIPHTPDTAHMFLSRNRRRPHALLVASLLLPTTGGGLNPLKNTTTTGHNELLPKNRSNRHSNLE